MRDSVSQPLPGMQRVPGTAGTKTRDKIRANRNAQVKARMEVAEYSRKKSLRGDIRLTLEKQLVL